MIIDAQRLIADHGTLGNLYDHRSPAHAPALHANELNEYWCAFKLAPGEEIQSTAWSYSPSGLTSVTLAPPDALVVHDSVFPHARGVRLSTPTPGTLYTIECAVTTTESRALVIRFILRGAQ